MTIREKVTKKLLLFRCSTSSAHPLHLGEHRKTMEKKVEKSHMYKHYRKTSGHRFNFEDVQVLATENLEVSREFSEGMYTKLL